MNRINAAYGMAYNATQGSLDAKRTAGMSLLIKVVTQVTGVPIDHFVQVSLLGFVRISDAIGNVPIDLCHSVGDTVAHNRSVDRAARQRYFLTAAFRAVTSASMLLDLGRLHHLIDAVRTSIYADPGL